MLIIFLLIKWLSNSLVNQVFKLFINIKTKNKRHEKSFGVAT
jgi:hypothetical protein